MQKKSSRYVAWALLPAVSTFVSTRGAGFRQERRNGRQECPRHIIAAVLLFLAPLSAGVIDRVAVVVGNQVVTETEVQEEVRVTEFLNGEPVDLGPAQRRAAAERLVDQQLIRNDMVTGGYSQPPAGEADKMLADLKEERFHGREPEYRATLARYGITEAELKEHLRWQLAVMRFTDARFSPNIPREPAVQTANRMRAGAAPAPENGVEQQLEAWLKEARSNTRIQFRKEAFQ